MTLLLIVLLIVLLFGGGWGYRTQFWGYGNPVGLVLLVILIVVLLGLVGGPHWGWGVWR
jgi:hypothetical protein